MVDLEAFHGPLDLLLYLVERNQVDIYDIPVAVITEQYIEYLETTREIDLEQIGDFLLIASYLLNLKSQMLLPANNLELESEEDIPDPRRELVEKLIAYKHFKEAAEWLDKRQQGVNRIYYREELPEKAPREELVADLQSLVKAYKAVLRHINQKPVQGYELPQGDVSVSDKMQEIVNRLKNVPKGMVFQDLFKGVTNRREALALFLALLELIRLQQVTAVQSEMFGDIEVRLNKKTRNPRGEK